MIRGSGVGLRFQLIKVGIRVLSCKQQLPGFMPRVTVCLFVGGGSFPASSSHYIMNLCTIFSCSILMGSFVCACLF